MRDFASTLDAKRAISPAAAVADNTPVVSQIIDISGFQGVVFLVMIGALADTDATFTALIEHGDASNLSDAAAVADDQLSGTEADAGFDANDDNAVRKIGYVGSKRYVRLTITPAGNSGNAFVSAVAVMLGARFTPGSVPA